MGRSCHAAWIDADAVVFPADAIEPSAHRAPSSLGTWMSTDERWPSPGHPVTIDTSAGPVVARLHLTDDAPGGAVWRTSTGALLDLDEVSRWCLRSSS